MELKISLEVVKYYSLRSFSFVVPRIKGSNSVR